MKIPRDILARPGTVGRRPSVAARSPALDPGAPAGTPIPSGPPAAERLQLPPDFFPPPESSFWRATGFITLGAAAPPTEVARQEIPDHTAAYARDISLQVNDLLAADRITFRVRINGSPEPGWTVEVIPGNLAVKSLGFGADFCRIAIPGGSTVSVTASRTDAGSNTVGATIGGWWYPEDLQRDFYGG